MLTLISNFISESYGRDQVLEFPSGAVGKMTSSCSLPQLPGSYVFSSLTKVLLVNTNNTAAHGRAL